MRMCRTLFPFARKTVFILADFVLFTFLFCCFSSCTTSQVPIADVIEYDNYNMFDEIIGIANKSEQLSPTTIDVIRNLNGMKQTTIHTSTECEIQVDLQRCEYILLYSVDSTNIDINIDLTYPILTAADIGVANSANGAISALVENLIGGDYAYDRLSRLSAVIETSEYASIGAFIYSADLTCETTYFSGKIISFVFRALVNIGSAHPVTMTNLITIDCDTGEKLTLDEVFSHSSIMNSMSVRSYSIQEGMYSPAGWKAEDENVRNNVERIVGEGLSDNSVAREDDSNFFDPAQFVLLTDSLALLRLDYSDSLYGFVILMMQVE